MKDVAIAKLKSRKKRYAVGMAPGLQLVVHPSGKRSWIFRYRIAGHNRSMRLGSFPAMNLAKARKMAGQWRMSVELGKDPAEARSRGRQVTVRAFAERWLDDVVRKARKDAKPVERLLAKRVYPALGKWPIDQVTVGHVRELIFSVRDEGKPRRPAGKPEAAAALRHLLKRLFDYAVACEAAPGNPVRALPLKFVTVHRSRQRALSERELKAFLQRLSDAKLKHLGWVLELMLLTMCRKSELRLARWEHVDFQKREWEIPAENSKTGVAHIVYLSLRAAAIFTLLKGAAGNAQMVLPKRDSITEPIDAATLNKAVHRVKWGIAHFTPHDLRRTASTLLNEQGWNRDVIEKALNHSKPGVRGVYNRAEYKDERRRMLDAWAEYLSGLKDE